MNSKARAHLATAKGYIAKGDGYYEKAAKEIRAARDDGATWVEIGDALGHGEKWARYIVKWAETPANQRSRAPYAVQGDIVDDPRVLGHAKTVLAKAPLEQ